MDGHERSVSQINEAEFLVQTTEILIFLPQKDHEITRLGDMPYSPYLGKSTRCCKNLARDFKKESFRGLIQFNVHSCEIPQLKE